MYNGKDNQEQFKFNTLVEEHLEVAKKELGKLTPIPTRGRRGWLTTLNTLTKVQGYSGAPKAH